MELWTVSKLLDWTTNYFKKFNIEWPHLEAEILLAHALGLKRIDLYIQHERILNKEELAKFKDLIKRREKKEPIAYITNNQPFMSLDFYVDQSVLIPRPETELLVGIIIDLIKNDSRLITIADIGTGSGCIAVSLAKYLPQVKTIGIDASQEAIVIAHKNAVKHGLENRCEFRFGSLLDPLAEKVDMILSNPPYIQSDQIEKLQEEVAIWEPRDALDGGKDGLEYIRKIIEQAPAHLASEGKIYIEIGFDQKEKVKELARETGKYQEIRIIKDLSGKDRIFYGKTIN
jgi:release factor glutamine methyltransferase